MQQELKHESPHDPETHHHKPRHLAEKFEGYIGIAMVVAVCALIALLVYLSTQSGDSEPRWMR